MITKTEQTQVLKQLDLLVGITDVYFAKGVLFIINSYDVDAVSEFLDQMNYQFQYQYVESDVGQYA